MRPPVSNVGRGDIFQRCAKMKRPQTSTTGYAGWWSDSEGGDQRAVNHAQEVDEIGTIGSLFGRSHMSDYRDPISVNMAVNGVLLNMEVNTDATMSLISWKTWQTRFLKIGLQPSTVRLKTSTVDHRSVETDIRSLLITGTNCLR